MGNPHPQQTFDQYKMRRLGWNSIGSVFGITLPRKIAEKYMGVKWSVEEVVTKDSVTIVLTSGIDIAKMRDEINKYTIADI